MMDKEDFKLIASLGDWSDERMGKVFYATYVKVLEKKFEEYEERKTQLKDFVQRNYANVKLPKTPKRMNPAAKLFEQIQTFRMVNFDSDESDDTPVNTQKATRKARIPTQILQQLQNVGIHEEHQTPNLRKHKVPLGKQISGPRAPAIVTAQPIVPRAVTASSTATLSTAASSTILSVHSSASRTVAGNSKILETYKKEQQQLRLKERELAAEKHRMEIINDKKERVRREREERQLRVEANNRLKMAEQQKREQEQREQQERLRVYQLKQKEMEKSVRSPAAKSRKMGTPRSLRKPPVTATIIQQPQIVQKQQFTHDADLIKNSKTHTELENLHNILQSERIPSLGVTEKPANDNSGMEEEMDDADDEGNEDFTENNFNTAEGEDNLQIADVQTTESPQNGNSDRSADARPASRMEDVQQPTSSQAIERLQTNASQQNAYDMTPDKVFLPSTKDNYNVDDLSSADETDSEENPRKEIPFWAKKPCLGKRVVALRTLVTEEQRERHFGRIAAPNINDFFGGYQKEYALRSSSAVWDSPMSDPTPGIGRYCV